MKRTAKLTSVAALLAALVLIFCVGCSDGSSAVVAQGKVDNIRWALDDAGKLSFTGTGALPGVEYSLNMDTGLSDTVRPQWYDYRDQVEEVIVGANIDSVSMNAFMSFSSMRVLDISATVESIDGYAVSGCPALEKVIIRGEHTELERFCIGYVGGVPEDVMSDVTFEGVRGSDTERYASACGADFDAL
ncbi:MAG: hypothetical protein E7554_03340 [Ruminococcaceae bacterium]|nr:hypothetical protein [Oscillospiraceae bacterium]